MLDFSLHDFSDEIYILKFKKLLLHRFRSLNCILYDITIVFITSINCSNIVNQLQYVLLQNQITSIKKKVISMELMDLTQSESLSSEYSGSVKQLWSSILSSS